MNGVSFLLCVFLLTSVSVSAAPGSQRVEPRTSKSEQLKPVKLKAKHAKRVKKHKRAKRSHGAKKSTVQIQVQGVQGVDVSEYDKFVDWTKVAAADKKFTFIRASHGLHQDATFADNWKGAKDHGIIRGAYHYLDPKEPHAPQLRYFVKTVKLEKGDFPPVLDLEQPALWTHMKQTNRIKYVMKWVRTFERIYKVKPIIYLSPNFVGQVLGTREAQVLKDYPLWIANYRVATPTVPSPWTSYIAWQYSESGSCPGIPVACDLDVAPGTMVDLMSRTVQHGGGGDEKELTADDLDDEGLNAKEVRSQRSHNRRRHHRHRGHSRR